MFLKHKIGGEIGLLKQIEDERIQIAQKMQENDQEKVESIQRKKDFERELEELNLGDGLVQNPQI